MRLVFMGSPEFAVSALQALITAGHDVLAVYTQPPKPAGRGRRLQAQPVHKAADILGLPVRTPQHLRGNEEAYAFLAMLAPDAIIVAAYGLILPPELLSLPPRGCLNIHASLLPRWRGASPIQSAIRAGDTETGICIMQMEKGLDTGPVLLTQRIPISPEDTSGTVHDRLSALGAKLIVQTLEENPPAKPQNHEDACYAPRLTREDGHIDWSRPAHEIDCLIRAFTPWPGTFTSFEGETWRIGAVRSGGKASSESSLLEPGSLVDDRLGVLCGDGQILQITHLQKPGRAMMEAAAFLRGQAVRAGERFD